MTNTDKKNKSEPKIQITKNGSYLVSGNVPLNKENIIADETGCPRCWQEAGSFPPKDNYSLCRCGQSKTKPYCDGTHTKVGFDGAETASRKPFLEGAEKTVGPDLILYDNEKLCSIARFCHRSGDTWTLTENSGDPQNKEIAIQEAKDCPSGRLVACDKKTGQPLEPEFAQSISVIEDLPHKVSGPLWVKGGMPIISADGTQYEIRNRVTLCRCGQSKNKPFCDGSHIEAGFTD